MLRLWIVVIVLVSTSTAAQANWQLYRKDRQVAASFDLLSFAPYHGQPAVWVRWHYVTPRSGLGGVKLLFTADCQKHRLYDVAEYPYDTAGEFLTPRKHYRSPKEYPLSPGSLNEATYKLLCH
ncbi:hypothetical protein GMSM_39680 [Geomonas sp. Red276]